jgi:N-succinyldiaminopimelate aminotransferase
MLGPAKRPTRKRNIMPRIADRVAGFGTTIFTEINQLAAQHNALNLGQGKPDFDGPFEIVQAFAQALTSGEHNQYAPGPGVPVLRQAIAEHARASYNLHPEPEGGVIVTPGATEALFVAVMGLIDPGDEVIVIEPFFDSYVPDVLMAGGVPVYVPLHAPDWTFNADELRAAFTDETRLLMLNTPHNPTGRVFNRDELQIIADLCIEHDVTVISDDVYEHLLFGSAEHIPIATLAGMFERTVTIGSAGKSFGMTGWKVGWAYGPQALIKGVGQAHQFVAFAVNHPAQIAVAQAFNMDASYYDDYRAAYSRKRALILQGIDAVGMSAFAPQGTYFVMADFRAVFDGDDVAFARHLITEIGVATIPSSFFYSAAHKPMDQGHVRLSFAKHDSTLEQAAERLARLR